MGVTIDNLQIEIQSSSTDASKGIEALAHSLGELKKNSSFKTVSKNLESLSVALRNLPNVYQASNSLRTLANSIEKLKGVGTVASLSNSLKKLPEALKGLSGIDLDRTEAQLEGVARAVSPLSSVKAGGLGTMVNALSKLGDVTAKLDDDTIKAFADKIEILNAKLGPLSEKMTSIKAGFSAINSKARSASSGVKEFSEGVNTSTLNMSSFIEVARTVVEVLQNAIQRFSEFMAEAIEWDGIAARFGRGFGEQASETYAWIQRLNEEMGINVQEFMKYSSVYSTMLTGFGVATRDAGKMAVGYMELTYDIWAGYNDVYGSLEETAEAVKSAIAGEVEPVRRAGFTIVESTLKQTAANHGLEISLENATEAQKSYLRYLTLVDQAHAQNLVGTYSKELNTAEGLMRTFAQQLKSLTQAFGSLFLPILVKVMPYLQAFVELLTEGVHWLANLFGVEIQQVDFSGYEAGAGAIDNIADSAGSATNALDSATKAAKELKNATVGIDELNVISPPSATGGGGAGGAGGGAGGNGFAGLDVDSLWDESIFDNIQSDVDAIKEKMRGWMPVIASVATALAGLRLVKLLKDVDAIGKTKLFAGKIKGLASWVSTFASLAKEGGIVATLAAAFPKLSTAISGIGTAIAGIGLGPLLAIVAAIASVVVFLVKNWDELTRAFKDFIKENVGPKLEEIGKHFEKIKEAFKPVIDLFEKYGIVEKFGTVIEWLGGILFAISTGPIMGAINAIASMVEGLVQYMSGTIQVLMGWVDVIVGIFTLDGEKIKAGAKKIVDGIVDSWAGLYDLTIGAIVEFFDGVVDWFKKLWDVLVGHSIVPDTINAIVKWFTGLPGKIFGSIDKFVTGIIDKFKGMWSKLVSWWNGKTKLKEYTPSIGSIYDKLKARWDNAKDWWNNKKTKLKEYTPSIGSIYEKVYDRWKNARDWWNSKKGSFKSYTPSIGSIVDKVKSAWNSAKSWWNKNANLSTKLNIKTPKLTVNWGEVSALGKTFKYPKSFSLKFAAEGGIFDQGSLIWAGERGPEIMANAGGGKTGVMNIQQMQEAVYEGVYAAMSAALRGMSGGGGQDIRVYLDGREISSSVKKHQHESGATIMGNEVYAY